MVKNMSKKCISCDSPLESKGYNGDWEVFDCTNCHLTYNKPVSNPSGDGYTMEDLGELSDIDWSE